MTIEHHPVADLFPMLPDDELKDLAADIRERGWTRLGPLDVCPNCRTSMTSEATA